MNFKALVLSVSVLLITASCSKTEKKATGEIYKVTRPIVVDTVYTEDFVASISALQNVEIRSRINGFIEEIHVDEGKNVSKGQILFSISSKEYEQRLHKAQAITNSAIAELKASKIELENTKKLLDKEIIAKAEYELAVARVEALQAKLDEAKADEEQANLSLSYSKIKAPFDGIINRIPNKVGSLIEEGDLLTTISNNSSVYAYFHVSEKEYLDYATSTPSEKKSLQKEATLILANGEEYAHKGIIETSESEFDPTTGNIAFRAKFPNPDGLLKHGSNGKVVLDRVLKKAILIPQRSTFEIQDKLYVYVVKSDSTLEQRNIVSKLRFSHLFVIESGLSPDETILYEGVQRVKEGDKIVPSLISFAQQKQ